MDLLLLQQPFDDKIGLDVLSRLLHVSLRVDVVYPGSSILDVGSRGQVGIRLREPSVGLANCPQKKTLTHTCARRRERHRQHAVLRQRDVEALLQNIGGLQSPPNVNFDVRQIASLLDASFIEVAPNAR
jgi:hypothetical protein